jgi:crossover junction endodeoxyribonuclease RuvC
VLVLGVDPALRHTGLGLVRGDGRQQELVHHEVVSIPASIGTGECLRRIVERINVLVDTHAPDCIVVEKVFVGKDPQAAFSVGQVKGVVLLAAASRGIPIEEYHPLTIKSAVTGSGRATKEQVQFMIGRILHCPDRKIGEDEADAMAMAVCHLQHAKLAAALKR